MKSEILFANSKLSPNNPLNGKKAPLKLAKAEAKNTLNCASFTIFSHARLLLRPRHLVCIEKCGYVISASCAKSTFD